jgi:Tfp pilus assembly protein PilP
MRLHALLALGLLVAACGDDPPPPQTRPNPAAKAAAAKKKKKKKGNALEPRMHVEEAVACPVPDKPTGPECKQDAPTCDAGLYCLQTGKSFHCEPCPERDSIRHQFKDRDFVADQVRDPYQSFIVGPQLDNSSDHPETTPNCARRDQLVATNYSYQDLHLVGIVSQGTQRKVLMMDSGNLGHIIKRGDCVGKERAVVKDIGTGYVTFLVESNPNDKVARPAEEKSVQLHPNGLQVQPQSAPEPAGGPAAPIVAPPPVPVPAPATAPAHP